MYIIFYLCIKFIELKKVVVKYHFNIIYKIRLTTTFYILFIIQDISFQSFYFQFQILLLVYCSL
jgi:hypothetical protein